MLYIRATSVVVWVIQGSLAPNAEVGYFHHLSLAVRPGCSKVVTVWIIEGARETFLVYRRCIRGNGAVVRSRAVGMDLWVGGGVEHR